MSALKLASVFNNNRLCLQQAFRRISISSPLAFRPTPCLMAEPLKKKKKMDPAIVKAREERKKKKIEKQIRRLEKNARQLKPIDECEVSLTLLDERKSRVRPLPAMTPEVLENRALLEKQWAAYKQRQHLADVKMLDRIGYSQQKALDELKKESEELYREAMQIDLQLQHLKIEGPLETPIIEKYDSPDGDYADVSKKWE